MNSESTTAREAIDSVRLLCLFCILAAVTAGSAAATQQLDNGVPVTGLSGEFRDEHHFLVRVPEGAEDLRIGYFSGSGDAGVYIRFDAQPSLFDHHPISPGPIPTGAPGGVLIPNPSSGDWYVMVYGFGDFSDFELEASYVCEEGCEEQEIFELENGVPLPGLGGPLGDELDFFMEVPTGAIELQFVLSGGVGDGDMYVKHGSSPTLEDFDCAPRLGAGSDEICYFETPEPGTWYVMVHAYSDFGGAELYGSYGEGSGCLVTSSNHCLNEGRFHVEVEWRDFEGNTGSATSVPLGEFASDDSGLFFFFSPSNWEMLVKVLEGCPWNDHYWVFAAATTDVEYTLRVTDTQTGQIAEYFNPLGNAAAATTDTFAFPSCP